MEKLSFRGRLLRAFRAAFRAVHENRAQRITKEQRVDWSLIRKRAAQSRRAAVAPVASPKGRSSSAPNTAPEKYLINGIDPHAPRVPGRIRVESYDNFEYPEMNNGMNEGDFDTLEAAIARAQAVVDASLQWVRQPRQSAAEWYSHYKSFGNTSYLCGVPDIGFRASSYAKLRIEALTGERLK